MSDKCLIHYPTPRPCPHCAALAASYGPSELASVSGSETGQRARDQQWLQDCCELVKNKMPDGYSFVVFGFPSKEGGRCYYASSAKRESVVAALKVWLEHAESDYLKHVK